MLTYKTGAAGSAASAMAAYLAGSEDVPEMAARLATYLGDAYALNVAEGTAALPMLDMHPLIAGLLDIDTTRSLTNAEMANLLGGKRASGEAIPGKEIPVSTKDKTRLAFCDFTFSAPKSLSIAIALAPSEQERITLETAFMRANNDLMKHVAQEIGGARQGDAGKKGVIPGHMAVIQYHHHTARPTTQIADGADTKLARDMSERRPGDMQRHIHNVFLHATITDTGDVKSPDLRQTRGRIHEWGAIGHAYLSTHLRAAGVRVEIDPKTGLSRLAAVPEAVVDLYSTRTRQGEAMARANAAKAGKDFDGLTQWEREQLQHREIKNGRQAKEDLSEQAFWLKTAADAGYEHRSVINSENKQGLQPEAERARIAYEAALALLEPELARRSKLDGPTIRTMAARGMIASGIETPAEIKAVLSAFQTEGVRQGGRMTSLIVGMEADDRFTAATTQLHVDQEREAIAILKTAAADKTAALTPAQIEAAVQQVTASKGYDFKNEHGLKQRQVINALATGGRAIIGIGSAGVGKTTLLEPVINAYHEAGWQSYGVTLAWRQTHGLKDAGVGLKVEPDPRSLIDAGIDKNRAFAMAPFLKAIDTGHIALNAETLVVIDEIATIDTQQILALARAQARYGFKIAGIGDDKQCQAISAGNTISLFRRALGPEQIPELLSTVRQRRIEDRETAALFREGRADLALPRKDAAGLLALIPGDYHDAIKAGVDWLEKRQAKNAGREKYAVGVSVPTNADVHAFGLEYRQRQRAAGQLPGRDWTIRATDQRGVQYDLALTVGDTVRLFNRVNASLGQGRHGYFGENGTVASVVAIDPGRGLTLQRKDGTIGTVSWMSLQDKETTRIRLSYGSALTIDARQSETLTDHLTLLPDGSKAIDGHKAYSAGTRARENDMLITSHGAEKEEVRNRRPLGDPWLAQATDAEMRNALIDNMARNLSRQPTKVLGVDFLDGAVETKDGGINTEQAIWFRPPQDAPPGATPLQAAASTTQTAETLEQTRAVASVADLKAAVEQSPITLQRIVRRKQPGTPLASAEARAEFTQALRDRGLRIRGELVMDGNWHRAAVEGDKGKTMSGRYRGYMDGVPAGFIQNFKTGVADKWRFEGPVTVMTAADHRQRDVDRAARLVEQRTTEEKAAARAVAIWDAAKPVAEHAYLLRKNVAAHDIRQDLSGKLVVPVWDAEGAMHNIQTIGADGEKRFLAGARKQGLFAQIGDVASSPTVLIAEGYATAASLHEATRLPVVIAFDAGNLAPVAETIRAQHRDIQIIFAADHDHHLPRRGRPLPNVGKEKAEKASSSVGGIVIVPSFGDVERQPLVEGKTPPTDWNDFAAIHGKAKLAATIADALAKEGISMEEAGSKTTQAERDAARKVWQPTQEAVQRQQREAARQQQEAQRDSGQEM